MATTTNDIDSLFNDSDDDDLVENTISDKVTKESFLALVEAASNGGDFIKLSTSFRIQVNDMVIHSP